MLFADDDEGEEDEGKSKVSRRTSASRANARGDMWLREDGDVSSEERVGGSEEREGD